MRAIRFDAFGAAPYLAEVGPPLCPPRGAVVAVRATGLCRSDWHAWQGHDDDVTALPHVPGHEFAGVVTQVAPEVTRFQPGDRVTAPFIFACGRCEQCRAGNTQVCPDQQQPGFSLPGSFAELVAVTEADLNLVSLPHTIGFVEAAGLGCRFATAYHALHARGRVASGEWVALFGCGGVGLSAIVVARAAGARVVAVDPSAPALEAAQALGAVAVPAGPDAPAVVREVTAGGAHLSVDAFGSGATCSAAILSLRPRGRHVQVGLLVGADADPPLPMGRIVARELDLLGSHGIAVSEYEAMLADVVSGALRLDLVVGRTIPFEDLPGALAGLPEQPATAGMTVAVLP